MAPPLLLATSLPADEAAAWRDALARAMPGEAVETAAADRAAVEIAVVANPAPGALRDLPALRWVHSLWAGVDGLLRDETLPDVPVMRLVDPALARAMAETVAAAVLHLHRDLHTYAAQQRRREWRQHPARPAAERRVSVLGLGEMGRAAAGLLLALGFPVRGWSRSGRDVAGIRVFAGADGLDAALNGAEILVNALPLTDATRGLLNRRSFGRLAPGACLVNVGRGAHLVEADLLAALGAERIGHAVLDVFDQEPLPGDHPFWSHPGVTILPHVAAPTSMASAAAIVARAVAAYRATGQVPAGVDRDRGY